MAKPVNARAGSMRSPDLGVAWLAPDGRQAATDLVAADGQRAGETGRRDLAARVSVLDVLRQQVLQQVDLCAPPSQRNAGLPVWFGCQMVHVVALIARIGPRRQG